jgi:hypothetical protein
MEVVVAPRSRKFVVPALALLLVGAVGATLAFPAGRYTIVPGPVTGSYNGGINGTFRIVAATAPAGIMSTGEGGACLIFRAEDIGYSKMAKVHCATDASCTTSEGAGYCMKPNKQCWARPAGTDGKLCIKSSTRKPKPGPWDANTTYPISDKPIDIASLGVRKQAKARVSARLNCTPGGSACAPDGRPFILVFGNPTQL